jgi:hypothetical protein
LCRHLFGDGDDNGQAGTHILPITGHEDLAAWDESEMVPKAHGEMSNVFDSSTMKYSQHLVFFVEGKNVSKNFDGLFVSTSYDLFYQLPLETFDNLTRPLEVPPDELLLHNKSLRRLTRIYNCHSKTVDN